MGEIQVRKGVRWIDSLLRKQVARIDGVRCQKWLEEALTAKARFRATRSVCAAMVLFFPFSNLRPQTRISARGRAVSVSRQPNASNQQPPPSASAFVAQSPQFSRATRYPTETRVFWGECPCISY